MSESPDQTEPTEEQALKDNPIDDKKLAIEDAAVQSESTEGQALEEQPDDKKQVAMIIGVVILLIILGIGLVAAVTAMVNHPEQTETLRDIFIIFMAVEFMLIGFALVILIVQLAQLTALMQNEIKPILESTNETVNTLRGTSEFLSNNLVRPVIKANSTASAIRQALDLVNLGRSKKKE